MTLVINKLDVSDEGYYVAVIEFANYKTEALFLVKVEKLPGTCYHRFSSNAHVDC